MIDNKELVFKAEAEEANITSYSFACSHKTRKMLHTINNHTGIDVPEMFRKFARDLVKLGEKELESLKDTVA